MKEIYILIFSVVCITYVVFILFEVVVSGVASTPADVETYASCTMLAVSDQEADAASSKNVITACIAFLLESEFVILKKEKGPGMYTCTSCMIVIIVGRYCRKKEKVENHIICIMRNMKRIKVFSFPSKIGFQDRLL